MDEIPVITKPMDKAEKARHIMRDFVFDHHALWAFMDKSSKISIDGFSEYMAKRYPFSIKAPNAGPVLSGRLGMVRFYGSNYGITKANKNEAKCWVDCKIINVIADEKDGVKAADKIGVRPYSDYSKEMQEDLLHKVEGKGYGYCRGYCGGFQTDTARRAGFDWELKFGWPGKCYFTAKNDKLPDDPISIGFTWGEGPYEAKHGAIMAMYTSDFQCAYAYMKENGINPEEFAKYVAKGYPPIPKDASVGEVMAAFLTWYRAFESDYGITYATKNECRGWIKCGIPTVQHDHNEGVKMVPDSGPGRPVGDFSKEFQPKLLDFQNNYCKYSCMLMRQEMAKRAGFEWTVKYDWPNRCLVSLRKQPA